MLAPPVIFAALAGLFLFGLNDENGNQLSSTFESKPAPPLKVTPLGDFPVVEDADLRRGGVKLVNFWASWCAPCRVEHPNLETLAATGIPIYGVNYKDEAPKALKFLSDLGNPYAKTGQDASGRQAIEWGVYGVPETYVLDAKGTVILRFPGPITERVMTETILPAIKKAQP